jgi:hypothetical protein
MSTSSTLRIPLTIPSSLQSTQSDTIQFSIHNLSTDNEVFLEEHMKPSDLTGSGTQRTASLARESLPIFSSGGEVELKAWFWKGGRVLGGEMCGRIWGRDH